MGLIEVGRKFSKKMKRKSAISPEGYANREMPESGLGDLPETASGSGSDIENRNEVLGAPKWGIGDFEFRMSGSSEISPATEMEYLKVNKVRRNLDNEYEIEVIQSLALSEFDMGNAKSRIVKNGNPHIVQEHAISQIVGAVENGRIL